MRSLTDHVQVAGRYARSASLERDAQSDQVFEGYQLTGRVIEMLDRLTSAATAGTGGAWSITGPYGSGKSSLGLLIDALFGPKQSPAYRDAIDLVESVSPLLVQQIVAARGGSSARGFSRGLVTARSEPVTHTIVRALERATVQCFEKKPSAREFPEIKLLLAAIDDVASDDPRRTGPAPGSLVEVAVALSQRAPLLILIDEFGKNLEAAQQRNDADLYLLQLLAEAAQSTRGKPLFLITMQHLAFNDYAAASDSVQQREWAKVQGRFEDVAFVDSSTQTRQLISNVYALSSEIRDHVVPWSKRQAKEMAAANLFELSDPLLLESCYPLHPLSLAVLPELCRRYGQNERTLFGFLTSGDQRAVPEILSHRAYDKSILPTIRLSDVYDFFVSGWANPQAGGSTRWVEIALRLRDIAGISPASMELAKSIAILNLVATNGPLRASRNLLQLVDPDAVQNLRALETAGVIVYRDGSDEYRIWQGTGVDLSGIIERSRMAVAGLSDLSVLSDAAPLEPVVAVGHSMRTDTLRVFERMYLGESSDIQALQAGTYFDGRAFVVLDPDRSLPTKAPSGLPIVIQRPANTASLLESAREVLVHRNALEDSLVQNDWVARTEIRERLAEATSVLGEKIEMTNGTSAWHLLTNRGPVELTSGPGSIALSDAADRCYSRAVPIRNETLNRVELSSQGSKARRKLLLAMLEHEADERLGLEGNGPEAAMYVSLLEKTGLHRFAPRLEQWAIRPPLDPSYRFVWDAIDGELKRAKDRRVSLSDIHATLQLPPIGMKAGPIPVIVSAVLMATSDEVAVYEHGTFRPVITEEICDRMVRNPGHFEVKHFANSYGARRLVVEALASAIEIQPRFRKQRVGNVLAVVSSLVSKIAELPPITLAAVDLTDEAIAVRQAIVSAVEPDQLIFEQLPQAFGLGPVGPRAKQWRHTDVFSSRLVRVMIELETHYVATLDDLHKELFSRSKESGRRALSAQAQMLEGEVVDQDLRAFVLALATDSFDDSHWIENIATVVTRTAVRQWKPADRSRFSPELSGRIASLRRLLVLHSEMRGLGGQPFDAHRITLTAGTGKEDGVLVALDDSDRALISEIAASTLESLADAFGSRDRAEQALLAWSAEQVFPHVVTTTKETHTTNESKAANDA